MQISGQNKRAWEEWLQLCKSIHEGNAPLPEETEIEKQARIAHLWKPENYEERWNYYFGAEGDLAPLGWFHKKGADDIIIKKTRNNILEWPRETAKSIMVDVFYAFDLLVSGWLTGMILASETEDKANKLIGDLEAQLRNNRRIINDFGDFGITGSWPSGYWQTKNGIGFWAFGIGQNPAGVRNGFKRPNYGVVDDADSKKRAKNQLLIKEAVSWIRGEFLGCLQTKERIFVYANNRVAANGITAHLVGDIDEDDPKDPAYNHIKVYWTEDPKTHELLMPDEGGISCWPENYTVQHAIDRFNDMGRVTGMRQLYHKDLPEGTVFREEDFVFQDPLPLDQYDSLLSYTDPSFSESETADYKATVLLGLKGRVLHVLFLSLKRTTVANMLDIIYDLKEEIDDMNPSFYDTRANVGYRQANCKHYIEANITQKFILQPVVEQVADSRNTAWEPRFDERKKPEKKGRIENALQPLFERKRIVFNSTMRKSPDFIQLKKQFIGFPHEHDDGPDAIEGGWFYLASKIKKKHSAKDTARVGKFTKSKDRNR